VGKKQSTSDKLTRENKELAERLREAEDALSAIRNGDVDAIVVSTHDGERIFSLAGPDQVYRRIVETMSEAALTVSFDGLLLFANQQFSAMLGTPLEKLFGTNLADLAIAEDRPALAAFLSDSMTGLARARVSFAGTAGPVAARLSGAVLDQGAEKSLCIVASDLSELEASSSMVQLLRDQQQRLETALEGVRESGSRYRLLFENMINGFALCQMIVDDGRPLDFLFLSVSRSFEKLTGLVEVLGKRGTEVIPGLSDANLPLIETYGRVARTGIPERSEVHIPGLGRWLDMSVYSPQEGRFIIVFDDITERRRLAESLERERALLQAVIDSLPDLVFVKDREGRFVLVNATFAHAAGSAHTKELVGKSEGFLVGGAAAGMSEDLSVIETAQSRVNTEELAVFADASQRWLLTTRVPFKDTSGAVNGLVGISRDITERKAFEASIQQSQRLESLGVLAGGVAHDFNNILQAVIGNAELVAFDLPADSPARRSVEEIRKASKRGADLCRQMLAYAGRGAFQLVPLDLSEVILEIHRMLQLGVTKDTEIQLTLTHGLPPIAADVAQISQVVMSLVINASEAIGEGKGSISLATSALDCDRRSLDTEWNGETLREGRYVLLVVSDTGIGMDEATRSRIFEPFFTTKFMGRGLGLSAVLGIVRGHRGGIAIQSEPGRGTRVRIIFPASAAAGWKAQPGAACREWQGKGTVLVVDDEQGVRDVGRGMLERLGFCVLTAADGKEALEVYAGHRDSITCVLLDLTMPKMDGAETFQQMRALDPGAVIVLTSGYSERQAIQQFPGSSLSGFIQKPYQLDVLEQKLRQVLGR
jgi:two-component system, cell cycle sensor histidine kinase and response regulator CckA